MSQLEYFARRVRETKGMEHGMALQALRGYLRETPKQELLSAITQFSAPEHLRSLWEAGLDLELQDATLKRYEEIRQSERR